jgi:hypothetical protein
VFLDGFLACLPKNLLSVSKGNNTMHPIFGSLLAVVFVLGSVVSYAESTPAQSTGTQAGQESGRSNKTDMRVKLEQRPAAKSKVEPRAISDAKRPRSADAPYNHAK